MGEPVGPNKKGGDVTSSWQPPNESVAQDLQNRASNSFRDYVSHYSDVSPLELTSLPVFQGALWSKDNYILEDRSASFSLGMYGIWSAKITVDEESENNQVYSLTMVNDDGEETITRVYVRNDNVASIQEFIGKNHAQLNYIGFDGDTQTAKIDLSNLRRRDGVEHELHNAKQYFRLYAELEKDFKWDTNHRSLVEDISFDDILNAYANSDGLLEVAEGIVFDERHGGGYLSFFNRFLHGFQFTERQLETESGRAISLGEIFDTSMRCIKMPYRNEEVNSADHGALPTFDCEEKRSANGEDATSPFARTDAWLLLKVAMDIIPAEEWDQKIRLRDGEYKSLNELMGAMEIGFQNWRGHGENMANYNHSHFHLIQLLEIYYSKGGRDFTPLKNRFLAREVDLSTRVESFGEAIHHTEGLGRLLDTPDVKWDSSDSDTIVNWLNFILPYTLRTDRRQFTELGHLNHGLDLIAAHTDIWASM